MKITKEIIQDFLSKLYPFQTDTRPILFTCSPVKSSRHDLLRNTWEQVKAMEFNREFAGNDLIGKGNLSWKK